MNIPENLKRYAKRLEESNKKRLESDLDILENAIEAYFEPFVSKAITDAKWKLLNRIRDKMRE